MKNIKLLKGLLPTTIVLGSIPLATVTTSCSKTQDGDFVSFDKVQKELYGTYDEALGAVSVVEFDGFVLENGAKAEDLMVSIENCDFEGIASATISDNGNNTFKVQMLFQSDTYLYGTITQFDLAFSNKSIKDHVQKLTGLSVEFVYYDLVVYEDEFSLKQKLVTVNNKISYITEGIFSAYNTYEEAITDLSNFYVEVTPYSETISASAEIVPLYENYFAIKLNLDNISAGDVYFTYTIRNKKMPLWYKDFSFKLTISNSMADAFTFTETAGGVTLTKCHLQDASVSIPEKYNDVNVTKIYTKAFRYCYNLRNLHIPQYVNEIGQSPFRGTYIKEMTVDENNTTYTSKDKDGNECNCIMEKPTGNAEPTTIVYGCGGTTIANTITDIGTYAFQGCYNLEELNLPESVVTVHASAFDKCINLKKVSLNKTQYLSLTAFGDCYSLNEVDLGSQLLDIPSGAFRNCISLTNINIPASVQTINGLAFARCCYLENFSVASGNTYYTSEADGKSINGIIEIDSSTLALGGKNTTIPTSITKIGNYAFDSRIGMSSFIIPENTTEIGVGAFQYCYDLPAANLPNVVSIGEQAFHSCTLLETVNLGTKLTSIGKDAFQRCISIKTVDIPATCTELAEGAFYNCISLESVTLHDGIKSFAYAVFAGCKNLTTINFPSTIETLGMGMFNLCPITSADLSNTKITTIPRNCFMACAQLKEVKLSNKCTNIEAQAFHNCTAMKTFTADNLQTIGESAFYRCGSLGAIDLSKVTTLSKASFSDCHGIQEVNLSSLTSDIPESAFESCDSLVKVTMPDKELAIGKRAFFRGNALTDIDLSKATSIGDMAFIDCIVLNGITLSGNLTSIGEQAFSNTKALTTIVIPGSVTTIGVNAFSNSGLTTAKFEDIDNWKDKAGNTITLESGATANNAAQLVKCIGWTKGA